MKNNRTFLEKLLDGAKVEWRTIDEVSNKVSSGGTPATSNNSYYENGNIPWLRTQEVDFKEIWDTDIKITEEGLNNSSAKWIPKNCVIVAMYGATVGKIAINKIPLTTNQACANIEVNPEIAHYRYVFHYLMSKYEYIKSLGSGSQTNINSQIVKKIRIPIPPLSVQTEIVKILDALTTLTSELTSELTLRRKQYEYYREELLSHNDSESSSQQKVDKDKLFSTSNIQWLHLNEIYKFQYGIGNKIPTIGGEYPVYGSNGIVGSHNEYNSEDAPVIGHIGAYAGIVNWAEGKHFVTYNGIICNKINDNVNSRYAYYLLLSQNFIDKANKASQPFISYDILNKCIVPVPPLEEQQRIVSILDKFETLTNSITEGLPLAIEQSQKRYEYYREVLLNFS